MLQHEQKKKTLMSQTVCFWGEKEVLSNIFMLMEAHFVIYICPVRNQKLGIIPEICFSFFFFICFLCYVEYCMRGSGFLNRKELINVINTTESTRRFSPTPFLTVQPATAAVKLGWSEICVGR